MIHTLSMCVPGVRVRRNLGIDAPPHGAWLAEAWLKSWGVSYEVRCPSPLAPDCFPLDTPEARALAREYGINFVETLQESGVLRPHVTKDYLTPYQLLAAGYAVSRESLYLHWAPGAGKTIGGILFLLAWKGLRIVVTRAAARGTWEREVLRTTTLVPWVYRPESLRRARDLTLPEYARLCSERNQPPLVILGYETLGAGLGALHETLGFAPARVVFDEAHRASEHRRWRAKPREDGSASFALRQTPDGRMPVAVACMLASHRATGGRLAMSATPIPDRVSDLWAQLDLIDPGAWGKFATWANRYCAPRRTQYGTVYDGASNSEELHMRLAWRYFRVTYAESHGALPPKRREVVRLEPKDQVKELSERLDKVRAADRSAQLEIKLAVAASRKRRYVVERVTEAVEAGQKVFVACGRIKEAATIAEQLRKKLDKDVIEIHGGVNIDVDEEVDRYMTAPCAVLVGTTDRAGESLNLQDTDLMLITHLPWTWGRLWQLENRVSRIGQKRTVLIAFIVAVGSVDESIASIFLDKLPAIGRLSKDEEVGTVEDLLIGVDDDQMLDRIWDKIGIGSQE